MKVKSLLIVLLVVILLLLYSWFCYAFANHTIKVGSRDVITNYIYNTYKSNIKYDYLKAINNPDNTISVYIKIKNRYFNVVLVKNGNIYSIVKVTNDIPVYIK